MADIDSPGDEPSAALQPTDSQPPIVENLGDDARPLGQGLVEQHTLDVETHNVQTRRTIAYGTLGVLGLLYVVGVGAWVTHLLSGDDSVRLIFALSGIQTLGATIVGYYFAKDA